MQRKLEIRENRQDLCRKIICILFALAVVFSDLINIVLYYLGFCFEENAARQTFFILGNVIFAVACGVLCLHSLIRKKFNLATIIPLVAALAFFGVSFAVSLARFGYTTYLKTYGQQFICIALPAFLIGASGGARKMDSEMFQILERFGLLLIPAEIIYLNGALFACNPYNYGADLGIINYMNFAYILMPFLMAHCLQFSKCCELRIPITGKCIPHPQIFRGVLIALNWFCIMATGCRGPILSISVFCVLLAGYGFIVRKGTKRTVILALAMLLILVVNIFIVPMPGMKRLSRMNIFLGGLSRGEITTTKTEVLSESEIEELTSAPIERPVPPDAADPQEPEEDAEADTEELKLSNRGTLIKLSLREFLNAPFTGMGPLGFTVKYGTYSHSVLLDLLCETGIVGTVVLALLLILSTVRIVRYSGVPGMMLLFLIPYGVAVNVSGYIWTSVPLLFMLGYGLALCGEKMSESA